MKAIAENTIFEHHGLSPRLGKSVFIAPGARVIGEVEIGDEASIWFNTVIRGDVHWIKIGARTNIQDNTTIHVTEGKASTTIGSDVTIGHGVIVHGCTIENLCLIGMGAIILDGAIIRQGSFVAAGALVTPGKDFPPGSMIMGSPAKAVRSLTPQESAGLVASAKHYIETARSYM